MSPVLDHVALVAAYEGPKISVPFCLVKKLGGDFQAAAFLSQAAYLSALKRKDEGWFDLVKEGEGDLDANDIFTRFGSWEAMLGLKKDAQTEVRKKLKGLGLLEEKLRGIPAKLHYRVDSTAYLAFLTQENSQLAKYRQLDGEKSTSKKAESRQQDGAKPSSKLAGSSQQDDGESSNYSREYSTEFSKNKNTTTTCSKESVVIDKTVMCYQGAILKAIAALSVEQGQQVVDCFVDVLEKGRVIGDPDSWLATLVMAAKKGELRTAGAERIADRRRQQAEIAVQLGGAATPPGLHEVTSVVPGNLKQALTKQARF